MGTEIKFLDWQWNVITDGFQVDSTNIYYLDIIASTIVKFKEFRTNFHQQDSLFKQMETKQNQRGQEKQNL